METITISINLEPDSAVYFPGQKVQGSVVVQVSAATRCTGIMATCRGKAYLRWIEYNGQYNTMVYKNKENYMNESFELWRPTSDQEELVPGEHPFQFHFDLPKGVLPSSFEGTLGYIRYFINVEAVIPNRFNQTARKYFSFNEVFDLNNISQAKDPVCDEDEGSSCCLCFRQGPIKVSFTLRERGVPVGGSLKPAIRVSDASSSDVKAMTISLEQFVVYRSDCCLGVTKEVSRSIASVKVGALTRRSAKEYCATLDVPGIVPSLQHCNIMTLENRLQVKAEFGRCRSTTVTCPVIVGTHPLSTTELLNGVKVQQTSEDEGMEMEALLPGNLYDNTAALPCYFCTVKKDTRLKEVDFAPNYSSIRSS